MLELLITLLVLVAIAGVVWWVLQSVPLPEPLRIVVVVIVAIIAIVLLLRFLPGGGLRLH